MLSLKRDSFSRKHKKVDSIFTKKLTKKIKFKKR